MKYKLKLFASHLAISVVVALLIAGLVFWVWYPAPLAAAVGVGSIFIMMLSIDVILGPLLTLLVAKEGKKTLKMDLAVIAIIQIAALLYGLYNISITRPAYIAFDTSRFDLVQAHQLEGSVYYGKPKYVAVKPTANDEERMQRVTQELEMGVPPSFNTELYQDIDLSRALIASSKQSLSELARYNDPQTVEAVLASHPKAAGFFPLRTTNLDMTVLVDENGAVLAIIDLRPW